MNKYKSESFVSSLNAFAHNLLTEIRTFCKESGWVEIEYNGQTNPAGEHLVVMTLGNPVVYIEFTAEQIGLANERVRAECWGGWDASTGQTGDPGVHGTGIAPNINDGVTNLNVIRKPIPDTSIYHFLLNEDRLIIVTKYSVGSYDCSYAGLINVGDASVDTWPAVVKFGEMDKWCGDVPAGYYRILAIASDGSVQPYNCFDYSLKWAAGPVDMDSTQPNVRGGTNRYMLMPLVVANGDIAGGRQEIRGEVIGVSKIISTYTDGDTITFTRFGKTESYIAFDGFAVGPIS